MYIKKIKITYFSIMQKNANILLYFLLELFLCNALSFLQSWAHLLHHCFVTDYS